MLVLLLQNVVWHHRQFVAGQTIDVADESVANEWIAQGIAQDASNPPPPSSGENPYIPPLPSSFNTYIHYQLTPEAEWVIQHNLNAYPAVTVVDSAGNVVVGDVLYISTNVVKASFASSFSGSAYLN